MAKFPSSPDSSFPTRDRTKLMMVKIDPGAQVNTIPLSRYHTLFPTKLNKSRYPKAHALLPTAHSWMSHNGSPKPFLGHFVADVKHASEPRMYPHIFVCLKMLHPLKSSSYATLERLWIVAFKVPNLAATSQVDNLNVPTTPNPSSMRKTTKTVTFWDPIVLDAPLHCSTHFPTSCHGVRKTASQRWVASLHILQLLGANSLLPP